MKLISNLAKPLEEGTYTIFVKGTAEIYFIADGLSDFILDSTLTDTTGTFIAKQGIKIKAVFTTAEVVLI
jgi:hypothetical protein